MFDLNNYLHVIDQMREGGMSDASIMKVCQEVIDELTILKPVATVLNEGQARQIAIDWQIWVSEQSLGYGELAEAQAYFKRLAKKFDLTEEFKENGIL